MAGIRRRRTATLTDAGRARLNEAIPQIGAVADGLGRRRARGREMARTAHKAQVSDLGLPRAVVQPVAVALGQVRWRTQAAPAAVAPIIPASAAGTMNRSWKYPTA